jgi:hypothetical protein
MLILKLEFGIKVKHQDQLKYLKESDRGVH